MTDNSAIRPPCNLLDPLTSSEAHVLELMMQDYSDKEIALARSTTYLTVRDHKQHIYDKLGLEKPYRNKKFALQCAFQLGLIPELSDSDVYELVGDNPYKGLDAFQAEDTNLFFGREEFTNCLLDRLAHLDQSSRFLALVGASGSGKSSVIRAGVLPALVHDKIPGSSEWVIATMYPRNNPFYELEAALRSITPEYHAEILDLLRRDAYGLVRLSEAILPQNRPLLLVIDQFEELFTLVEHEQYVYDFMDTLYAAATDPRTQTRILITMRADFLDRPLMYPEFGWLIQNNTVMIGPMTPEELERTITQPARLAHVSFDPGVVAKLVTEANEQPGALPLLEFALTELYDNRVGSKITMQMYEDLGGIHQALTLQADKIYASLSKEQQSVARQVFLRLVTLGEGTEDVRRRMLLSELRSISAVGKELDPTIEFLTANRLLTTDRDRNTGDAIIEVAHEALIREWGLLRKWLDQSRHDLHLERLLSIAVSEWLLYQEDEAYLLRGSRLLQYIEWREQAKVAMTEAQNSFLDTSLAEHERQEQLERERQEQQLKLERRAHRFFQILTVVLLFAVVGAVGFTIFALDRESRANEARANAQLERDKARELALINIGRAALADEDYDTALAFALAANTTSQPSAAAQTLLADAAYHNAIVWKIPATDVGGIWRLVLHPDGQHFLTVPDMGVNKALWDVETGEIVQQFDPDNAAPVGLSSGAISPDGKTVAYGQNDSVIVLYDIVTGAEIQQLDGEFQDVPLDMAFSPDGKRLAVGYSTPNFQMNSCSGSLVLWDMETLEVERIFDDHPSCIANLEYSADGKTIITATSVEGKILDTNGIINFLNVDTGEIVKSLGADGNGHTAIINDVAVTRDGQTAVSVGWDGALLIWDVESETVTAQIDNAFENYSVASLALSPNDSVISVTTGGFDQLALYDMNTFEKIGNESAGHWNASRTLFVGDSYTLLTADLSGEVMLKDLRFGAERRSITITLDPEFLQTRNVFNAFSPDLSRVIFTTLVESDMIDRQPISVIHAVYDLETGELIARYAWDGVVDALNTRWMNDTQAVTQVDAGELIVWDVDSGEEIRRLPVPEVDKLLQMTQVMGNYAVLPTYFDVSESGSPVVLINLITSETRVFSEPEHIPATVRLSPDGRVLLSGGKDQRLIQWDVESGEQVRVLDTFKDWVNVAAIDPSSRQALTIGTGDPYLTLWDIETGEVLQRFNGTSFNVPTAWFTSEGIVFSGTDGIRLFDAETGELIRRFTPDNNSGYFLHDVAQSAAQNGSSYRMLLRDVNATQQGEHYSFVFWGIDSQAELLDWAQHKRYARELSCEERELYHVEPPCEG